MLIASHLILEHIKKIIHEVRQALHVLEAKQISTESIERYLHNLSALQAEIQIYYAEVMKQGGDLRKRLKMHEQHQFARVRL